MTSISIKNHLGLVAGMCRELQIAEMVDAVIPKKAEDTVSHEYTLVAMIVSTD